MPFTVSLIKPTDIARLTDIQWAALKPNPLIQTLYPRGATAALILFTLDSYRRAIKFPAVYLIKATDDETGEIVAFAKWILYRQDEEDYFQEGYSTGPDGGSRRASGWSNGNASSQSTPPDCHGVLLEKWGTTLTKTRRWLSGPRGHACKSGAPCSLECYFSSFAPNMWVLDILHTDPGYQQKGAGSELVKWGTDRADYEGLQCYVESSLPGYPVCAKNGFIGVAEMKISLAKYKQGYPDYKHIVMIRPPFGGTRYFPVPPKEEMENLFENEDEASPIDESEVPYTAEATTLDLRHSPSSSATLRQTRSATPSSSHTSPMLRGEHHSVRTPEVA